MSAVIIDLAATADAVRAAKATGQMVSTLIPAVISHRVGDYVYDPVSQMSGHISHFNHRDGETKAVIQSLGCSFVANLPDLLPALSSRQQECH